MHHNQAGWSFLYSLPSHSQTEDILNGVRHSQQKCLQSGSVLFADQAIKHWVKTAICMSQTYSQGESIGLGIVEGFTKWHQVKFDQHPPQSESLVWQPADEEGENYNGDGAGDFRTAAAASPLVHRLRCDSITNRAAYDPST